MDLTVDRNEKIWATANSGSLDHGFVQVWKDKDGNESTQHLRALCRGTIARHADTRFVGKDEVSGRICTRCLKLAEAMWDRAEASMRSATEADDLGYVAAVDDVAPEFPVGARVYIAEMDAWGTVEEERGRVTTPNHPNYGLAYVSVRVDARGTHLAYPRRYFLTDLTVVAPVDEPVIIARDEADAIWIRAERQAARRMDAAHAEALAIEQAIDAAHAEAVEMDAVRGELVVVDALTLAHREAMATMPQRSGRWSMANPPETMASSQDPAGEALTQAHREALDSADHEGVPMIRRVSHHGRKVWVVDGLANRFVSYDRARSARDRMVARQAADQTPGGEVSFPELRSRLRL